MSVSSTNTIAPIDDRKGMKCKKFIAKYAYLNVNKAFITNRKFEEINMFLNENELELLACSEVNISEDDLKIIDVPNYTIIPRIARDHNID